MSSKRERDIPKHYKNTHEQYHQQKKNNYENTTSSSLIEILQSFGICVRTKVSYHDQRKRDDFDRQFLEQYMNTNNYQPVLSGSNENGPIVKAMDEGKVKFQHSNYFVNIRKSRILMKFKCAFDHTESFTLHRSSMVNESPKFGRQEQFKKICDNDRKERNVMHIEFDLKFDSFVEVVKYLNVSNFSNVKFGLENEILSRLVEILDVDNEKKQVYIKLKTLETNQDTKSNTNLCFYYLMGKIDGTDSCFMLDLTYLHWYELNITTIDNIYRYFTPKFLKDRIYGKGRPNTFHDCKDAGIYRVLIGSFFYCLTDKSAGSHIRYSQHHPSDIVNADFLPCVLNSPSKGGSIGLIVEKSLPSYSAKYYGGIVETGFYSFELKSICKYHHESCYSFTREFYHFSL